ncbi:MAG: glycosyltransferase family 2 protein [Candidatus Liptonbacteria bacterium]
MLSNLSGSAPSTAPRITILLATYNRAHALGPTIESIRAQSFSDWEIVITDDGSTDNTPETVREWQKKEPRIRYVRSEVNQGISKNYNQGFKIARGEYIAMIDDDDPWCDREKLKKQLSFLGKNPEYVGCGGGVVVVDQTGKELYRYLKPEKTGRSVRACFLVTRWLIPQLFSRARWAIKSAGTMRPPVIPATVIFG